MMQPIIMGTVICVRMVQNGMKKQESVCVKREQYTTVQLTHVFLASKQIDLCQQQNQVVIVVPE